MTFKSSLALILLACSLLAVAEPTNQYRIVLELPQFDTGNYERPYVAVWIATEQNQPVKVVRLWREHERWLKDLKYFWRRVLRINRQSVDGVTGATRGPGEYVMQWDGRNQQGSSLSPGRYKLCAEVAREYGGRTAKCLHFDYPLTSDREEIRPQGEFTLLSIEVLQQ